MPAAITDLLTKATSGTRPSPTTLTAAKTSGSTTAACSALTGWPTDTAVHFIIYSVDPVTGAKVAGSQTDWKGIVSGTNIQSMVLKAGTDPGYPIGAVVEMGPTAAWANDMYAAVAAHANPDGSLTQTAVQAALGIAAVPGGWTPAAQTWSAGVNNGNKEYTMTMNGDVTSLYTPGMRVRFDRTAAAPTQSFGLVAASSQYATKASPAGISFTAAFTIEAWVYLNSYTNAPILSRDDGTNGFECEINLTGNMFCYYRNGSGFTGFQSYQNVPLKRWVHLAYAVTSVSAKTGVLYINGAAVPSSVISGAATSMVQGTAPLQIGKNSGANYLDGYVSEVRLWSVGQTQAQIQASMSVSLIGSETNLVGLWQGNGNFNDKTANANALTATNGMIATYADNPYKATEYGIITKVAYSNPTSTLTVFTGTDYNVPMSGGIQAPYFSSQKAPFGFPTDIYKWIIDFINSTSSQTLTNTGTYQPVVGHSLTVPTGAWRATLRACTYRGGVTGQVSVWATLSTTTTTETFPELRAGGYMGVSTGTLDIMFPVFSEASLLLATTTNLNLLLNGFAAGGTLSLRPDTGSQTILRMFCAYL